MKRRLLETAVGLGVGAILLWWVLRGFDWHALRVAVQEGIGWLLIAGLFMTGAHLLRAWRWQLMMRSAGSSTDFAAPWWALMVGYLVNTALPRVGEVVRCTLLWRWRGVPVPVALGTVVAERLVDVLILALLSGTVVLVEGPGWLRLLGWGDYTIYFLVGGGAAGIVGLLALRYLLRRRRLPWIEAALRGFESLWCTRPRWIMLLTSIGIWAGYGAAVWGTMKACTNADEIHLIWSSWLLLVGSGLAMALPVPGGIGTFHAIGLILLTALSWPESEAKLTVFAAHTLQTLLVLVLGGVGLLWATWQRRQTRQDQ